MAKTVKQSLIIRSGMALAAVLLLAVVNMLVSYLTAEHSENDAVRINLAGSLRMQSYRLISEVLLQRSPAGIDHEDLLAVEIAGFEQTLNRPVLRNYILSSDYLVLKQAFLAVEEGWSDLLPRLTSKDQDINQLLIEVNTFVSTIDFLVKKLELQTENKFRLLRVVQLISLFFSLCILTLAFYHIYYNVVGPLQALVAMATKIRGGDFSVRITSSGDDELSLLTETLNEMAESLDAMYHNLEHKVTQKTLHLERVQVGLRLLYKASRGLNSGADLVVQLQDIVSNLREYLGADSVDIYLTHVASDRPFFISSSDTPSVLLSEWDESLLVSEADEPWLKFSLLSGDDEYGVMVIQNKTPLKLDKEQQQLLVSLVDTIVAVITSEVRSDQRHRLALMGERAAIARELHDSLAQSLSYAKIQVSRFQMLQKNQASAKELDDALNEIRTGIQSAYRQLRELLTTFRLQLDSPGLLSALQKTVAEFSNKGDLPVELVYELENYPLTPNEEVHLLQIIREALSNVLRHAQASRVQVLLQFNDSGQVEVSVTDDGCGFDSDSEEPGPNHYGKTIMRERAEALAGTIVFGSGEMGGAQVKVIFKSERLSEQQAESTH